MADTEKYSLEEAHVQFAKQANGRAWQLLEKTDRSPDEDDEMLEAGYASYYHWRSAGGPVHFQRGEWMIAHIYTALGQAELALRHARRCLALTQEHPGEMKDFDVAYGYEGYARALALGGDREQAGRYLQRAREAGERIENAEDREIFMGDLKSGDWGDLV